MVVCDLIPATGRLDSYEDVPQHQAGYGDGAVHPLCCQPSRAPAGGKVCVVQGPGVVVQHFKYDG